MIEFVERSSKKKSTKNVDIFCSERFFKINEKPNEGSEKARKNCLLVDFNMVSGKGIPKNSLLK